MARCRSARRCSGSSSPTLHLMREAIRGHPRQSEAIRGPQVLGLLEPNAAPKEERRDLLVVLAPPLDEALDPSEGRCVAEELKCLR